MQWVGLPRPAQALQQTSSSSSSYYFSLYLVKHQANIIIIIVIIIQLNPAISKSQGKWEKVRNSGVSK